VRRPELGARGGEPRCAAQVAEAAGCASLCVRAIAWLGGCAARLGFWVRAFAAHPEDNGEGITSKQWPIFSDF